MAKRGSKYGNGLERRILDLAMSRENLGFLFFVFFFFFFLSFSLSGIACEKESEFVKSFKKFRKGWGERRERVVLFSLQGMREKGLERERGNLTSFFNIILFALWIRAGVLCNT